jgi:hypothetical protein
MGEKKKPQMQLKIETIVGQDWKSEPLLQYQLHANQIFIFADN